MNIVRQCRELHEVIFEVRVPILVARLHHVLLREQIVVHMLLLILDLGPLLRYLRIFFLL